MKARAHGDGIALPNRSLSGRFVQVYDGMASGVGSGDGLNDGRETDVRPKPEVRTVVVQVLNVAFGAEKVGIAISGPEI